MSEKIKLWYSFGNHMHWVDMQWLWGYHVMPGSTFDMLKFCRETGAKGNVNFDGIGYEKMAAEAPEALQALREAVQSGLVEPVGCSYGQPYGLFHGGESNIRQRIYGVRTVMRLLGVRPKTFWEEEFDFFPQLPQMLRGCGFENASLYFQWTWHTPEVPFEESPVIWWEGIDGSKLLTATRNRLNLHQWPEDFQILLDELAEAGPQEVLRRGVLEQKGEAIPPLDPKPKALERWEGEGGPPADSDDSPQQTQGIDPLVLQWLELMPSPDWMCRSELMIPKLRELLDDPRFEIQFGTLKEYLAEAGKSSEIPTRKYGMHEVWHGLSLGKNSDDLRNDSARAEAVLLAAESFAATASLFGRPYAQWDVYPVWELEEAWRLLLMAQHHDNDECEGLCGHIGRDQYSQSFQIAYKIQSRIGEHFGKQMKALDSESYGPSALLSGWKKRGPIHSLQETEHTFILLSHGRSYEVSKDKPRIVAMDGQSILPPFDFPFSDADWTCSEWENGSLIYESEQLNGVMRVYPSSEGLEIDIGVSATPSGPGFQNALTWDIPVNLDQQLFADTAYCVGEVKQSGTFQRKYPKGDWMTSEQWFEPVPHPFTALSLVDFAWDDRRISIAHDRSRQWFQTEKGMRCVLTLIDPWDEDNFQHGVSGRFTINIHNGKTNSELWKWSQASKKYASFISSNDVEGSLPLRFSVLHCNSENVVIVAFYREAEDFASRGLDNYAGRGMGHPFVVRLVEFDAEPADVTLRVAGTVAKAFRTNLMGEIEQELEVEVREDHEEWQSLYREAAPGEETMPNLGGKYSLIRFPMKAREIATLYLDIEEGRKQPRDLDAHRHIWATVHRTEDEKAQS